jgi:hypothetical protein
MASLNEYVDGIVRMPLRLLTSDGFAECPSSFVTRAAVTDFNQFLHNPTIPITGIVNPANMMLMLREMGITLARLRETIDAQQTPLVNSTVEVGCLVGAHCLARAREVLGHSFECLVRIYCLPSGMALPHPT